MNLTSPWSQTSKFLFNIAMKFRWLLPKTRCQAFALSLAERRPKIGRIYVMNLTRQPARWTNMERELKQLLDCSGNPLWNLTERSAAFDARQFTKEPQKDCEVDPVYTLGDQLFVEPQPKALPTTLELGAPIHMSRPEVAIARSHISIWRQVAAGDHEFVLILEDDVWFRRGFASHLDQAWAEIEAGSAVTGNFDVLYLSYEEVKHGAPKTFLSSNVFRPVRGLWHLSGYVISRIGAEKLLRLLPCRGPVDLWMNHQFGALDVRATRRSIISQRRDGSSTNSYSILPSLTSIGAITSESAALFHLRPNKRPVFGFGSQGSGLSSLAMALSMLGYRCCSDLQAIPPPEQDLLLGGHHERVFDAYVNIASLEQRARDLAKQYPHAKFIITASTSTSGDPGVLVLLDALNGADVAILSSEATDKWQVICEHLNSAPPACDFPDLEDLGQRQVLCPPIQPEVVTKSETPKRDDSPWVVRHNTWWMGIHSVPVDVGLRTPTPTDGVSDGLESLNTLLWTPREDTFTGNLALFRPSNIEFRSGLGAALSVKREPLGVREYSAAALTSRAQFLFGRFEASIKASNVHGVVTGMFLHRNSPRQEIDIEFTGRRTDRLLVNVFYNPGGEGTPFDYGYRGAASYIDLGFDAAEAYHRFAIEWGPCEICWYVDDQLVHRRVDWNPTPIPHLPMAFHLNAWPSRSRELAGHLNRRRLPATSFFRAIKLQPYRDIG